MEGGRTKGKPGGVEERLEGRRVAGLKDWRAEGRGHEGLIS